MKHSRQAAFVFSLGMSWSGVANAQEHRPVSLPAAAPFVQTEFGFIENAGQWPEHVLFSRGSGPYTSWVERGGFVLQTLAADPPDGGARQACSVAFRFKGSEETGVVQGDAQHSARRHYLRGSDPANWVRGVRAFGQVRFDEVWPGVDVRLRELRSGALGVEYDLLLEPGADLERVQVELRGILGYEIRDEQLHIATAVGSMQHSAPVSWFVDAQGQQRPAQVRFRAIDDTTFGFTCQGAGRGDALVVDPGIEWSTYLGDLDSDVAEALVRSVDGDVLVCGGTLSPDFPHTPGAYNFVWNGQNDAFLSRFKGSDGSLVFSTFLGGTADDTAKGLAVLPSGQVWLAGDTKSVDFPVLTTGFDRTHNGAWDGFVVRLSLKGDALLRQTFLGAPGDDHITDLALDLQADPIVCGSTNTFGFPTTPGSFRATFQGGNSGGGDGFVSSFDATLGALKHSTYLGGGNNDGAKTVAVDKLGDILVAGWTTSSNFPLSSGALDNSLTGGMYALDGFVTRLKPDVSGLRWSTYFGGSGKDKVLGLAMASSGDVLLVGETYSTDLLITPHSAQYNPGGLRDGFYTRLSASGALVHSAYFGGSDNDRAIAVCEVSGGRVAVLGESASDDFPTTAWGFDTHYNNPPASGESDVIFANYTEQGQRIYASYFGGGASEAPTDVTFDNEDGVYICGHTNSYDFPTPGGFDPLYDYSLLPDGFLTRLDFSHYPVVVGTPKINSLGSGMYLTASGFPSVSGSGLQLWGNGSAGPGIGRFLWSSTPGPVPMGSGTLYMGAPYGRGPLQSLDWLGGAFMDVSMDPSMVGTRYWYQFWYSDPGDPEGFGLSDAIEVLIYP